jgi:small subunit ribosomal protein S7
MAGTLAENELSRAMPRKGTVERREVEADPVYGNPLVQKLINCLMHEGERSVAQKIVYESLELIKDRAKDDPLKVFKKALDNVKPTLEVKTRRVGGANYQVPVEVNRNRQNSLSLRWIIGYARERGEKSMVEKLTAELLDAANNRGGAIKKRDDTHRMAEANKAFAHYRW